MHGDGPDLAIVTYGNGRYLSAQARAELAAQGVAARIVDLRWLAPMPEAALLEAVKGCEHVLIVDECRITGSQLEALTALFAEQSDIPTATIAASACFIATGPAYGATLPSKDRIVPAAFQLAAGKK